MFPRFLTSIVSWRSVAVLAVVASVLQVTNVVLTWQLRQRQLISMAGEKNTALGPKTGLRGQHHLFRRRDYHLGQKLSDDHQAILTRIAHWSVLDGSGEFRVSTGVVRGTEGGQGEEQEAATQGLTLVTQCSFTRLQRLPPLASHWQGPISIAVFALSGEVQAVVQTFHLLRKCYPEVRANVTFSLVFPLNSPTSPHLTPTTDATPCDRIFSSARQPNYDFKGVQYPNNLLRNVARKATITRLMMVVDIDMIPGEGLHDAFVSYAGRQGLFGENSGEEKTVWVVPVYEIKEDVAVPKTKTDLLMMKENGEARTFYQELCFKCQRYTDYPAWEKKSEVKAGKVEPLYEVLWQDPWEPFYIASTKVPLYDERFRQYGFNRISQVCELHVAGYRFLVLDSAFVIHRGFKTNTGFHTTKDVEQERNRILFRQFKGELKERYPESSRRCY
ncbi:beta-1,4-glucuronyltransferase 1-like isoform X1 [Homarus americanus]|uniref:beta-1,4-glucuronyltransferase 1-like isoform X1 n=1 Tax=Homarus americanus TaxID=6706 RepID=UPI001C451D9B|nr:beta-1,4-glucuronyltransferase 1-like isoform X1 [Homarus americanus]XP_042243472.1 beta-1,4-glucuronyltransferase 1-like isoform X1 [Homarus americanus]